jgi:hypothetical protein
VTPHRKPARVFRLRTHLSAKTEATIPPSNPAKKPSRKLPSSSDSVPSVVTPPVSSSLLVGMSVHGEPSRILKSVPLIDAVEACPIHCGPGMPWRALFLVA